VETLVKDEVKRPAEPAGATPQTPDQRAEIEELLRIKRSRRIDGTRVPCPSCTVPVEFTLNRCPFCESDIAPETALARETTRRLRELSGELDVENTARTNTDEEPVRRGFFARLKYLFEGDPEIDPLDAMPDPHAKRLLGNVSQGDTLKVQAEDGPWLQVKTSAGLIGWVYSTIRKDS
jgi:hypothetical protein